MPQEAHNPAFLVQSVKHGDGSVKIWAAISWYFADPIITLNVQIAAKNYMDILGNQVRPVVQMFLPNNDAMFQDDIPPMHTARSVHSWFEEHEDALQTFLLASTIATLIYHGTSGQF